MKTVLFATDHTLPDPKALDYALLLCQRMAARLEVLQILPPAGAGNGYGRPDGRTAREAGRKAPGEAEGALSAAAADQLRQLHLAHPTTRIDFRCEIADESTGTIIERYVRRHRDIVLTVFDPRLERKSKGIRNPTRLPAGAAAMPRLAIPLVRMKKTH